MRPNALKIMPGSSAKGVPSSKDIPCNNSVNESIFENVSLGSNSAFSFRTLKRQMHEYDDIEESGALNSMKRYGDASGRFTGRGHRMPNGPERSNHEMLTRCAMSFVHILPSPEGRKTGTASPLENTDIQKPSTVSFIVAPSKFPIPATNAGTKP